MRAQNMINMYVYLYISVHILFPIYICYVKIEDFPEKNGADFFI